VYAALDAHLSIISLCCRNRLSKVGYSVKVKVDDIFFIDAQPVCMAYEGFLKAVDMRLIQRVGVGRERRAFGEYVQPGKQPKPQVECMVVWANRSVPSSLSASMERK
jgi:hypothetical protein